MKPSESLILDTATRWQVAMPDPSNLPHLVAFVAAETGTDSERVQNVLAEHNHPASYI